jgi:hypothetical protein
MERGEKWLLTSVTKTPNGSFHLSLFTVSRYPTLCLARCAATFARLPQALMLHQRRR